MIRIGNKSIGAGHPCFVIAEAGVNHNGDVQLARKLIDVACESGADAVKFQTYRTENLVAVGAEKADYQKETTKGTKSQYEMLKSYELDFSDFRELSDYSKKKGIIFLSTPFDIESAGFLIHLDIPAFKISSGEITNYLLLKKIAGASKPVILSTGMASICEIEKALDLLEKNKATKIILLHCTTNYPTKFSNANLRVMNTLHRIFGVPTGYSDHTEGICVPLAAVALGACIVEKHFTLDRDMDGPDHKSSLQPDELKKMVAGIRIIEKSLGSGHKKLNREETEIRKVARKSIVAERDIKKGSLIEESMIAIKRPGTGIEPEYWEKIIGRTARTTIKKDIPITWEMIE